MLSRAAPAALVILLCVPGLDAGQRGPGEGSRIVAIADVHGSLDGLTGILRAAGLVDGNARWIGRNVHLVQMGDLLDRGDDVRAVMDLLMRLESEARRTGGRVDVLFGNHEGMNLLRDFRDVSPGMFAAFTDTRSESRRRRAFDAHAAIVKRAGGVPDREAWMAVHPPGFVEYVEAIGSTGRYGRWLRSRKVVLQVDDTIFMHAGLSPATTATLDEINKGVEQEIRSWDTIVTTLERQRLIAPAARVQAIVDAAQVEIGRILEAQEAQTPPPEYVTSAFVGALQHLASINEWALIAPDGPLWYRGLATLPPEEEPAVDALLLRYKAQRFVTGHTPQLPGRITARFGGRVILADAGMLSGYYKGGQPAAVEIQGGTVTAIYPSGRQPVESSRIQAPSMP